MGKRQPPRTSGASSQRRRTSIYIWSVIVGFFCLYLLWAWRQERGPESPTEERTDIADEADAGYDFDELPETPPREEVLATLRKLTPYVMACGQGQSGVLRIHIAISGKTGAVTDAAVIKQFAGTELAKCATSIVEQAQFPRFRKKVLTVVYPVTLPGSARDGGIDGGRDADTPG